jgi:hypothetical protein
LQPGAIAQTAGGVPGMCDGITQGRAGMQRSLFFRDVIAMPTAIALSYNTFDGALLLGVCEKIVPGMLIGALSFGHLPAIFVPAGPMTSGTPTAAILDRSNGSPSSCSMPLWRSCFTRSVVMSIRGAAIPSGQNSSPPRTAEPASMLLWQRRFAPRSRPPTSSSR